LQECHESTQAGGLEMTLQDKGTRSRRELLSLGAASGMMGLLGAPGIAHAAVNEDALAQESINVGAFGAVGDAVADDTSAFQRALDAAFNAGGGTVYVPPGRYLFKGTLTVPDGAGLQSGTAQSLPGHQCGPKRATQQESSHHGKFIRGAGTGRESIAKGRADRVNLHFSQAL
jgi:hypothetical protein